MYIRVHVMSCIQCHTYIHTYIQACIRTTHVHMHACELQNKTCTHSSFDVVTVIFFVASSRAINKQATHWISKEGAKGF